MQNIATGQEDEFTPVHGIPGIDELCSRLVNTPMSEEKSETIRYFLNTAAQHEYDGDTIMAAAMRGAAAKGLELAAQG